MVKCSLGILLGLGETGTTVGVVYKNDAQWETAFAPDSPT